MYHDIGMCDLAVITYVRSVRIFKILSLYLKNIYNISAVRYA